MMTPARAGLLVRRALRASPAALHPGDVGMLPREGGVDVVGDGLLMHVDAGGAVSGWARVDPLRARLHLVTLTFLGVCAAWLGTGLFALVSWVAAVPAMAAGFYASWGGAVGLDLATLVGASLAVLTSVYLASRYGRWLVTLRPELLEGPLAEVTEGRSSWPRTGGVEELVRRSALLGLPTIVWLGIEASLDFNRGQGTTALLEVLATVPLLAAVAVFGARGTLASNVAPASEPPDTAWGAMLVTALSGVRMAISVVVVAMGLEPTTRVLRLVTESFPSYSELYRLALEAVVVVAILSGHRSKARLAVGLALAASLVSEFLFGDLGELGVAGVVLFLALRGAWRVGTREAIQRALEFELFLALGRVVGRVVTLVVLGPLALPLGEALGEQLAALSITTRLGAGHH